MEDVKTRIKERWEIENLVFDRTTLLTLGRFMSKGIFESLEGVISTGKEANVYKARNENGIIAVKIYKVETAKFFRRNPYLIGDPRFKTVKKSDRELVYLFCNKEYRNLMLADECGVSAPRTIFNEKNILAFSFLGREEMAFPKLSEVFKDTFDVELFYLIIEDIKKLYKNNLVHADISEYNLLYDIEDKKHYFIDFGQGVVLSHPKAMEFLERDIRNIVSFFNKKKNLKEDLKANLKYVLS